MRSITDHKLNGLNDALTISVLDEPGQGGACHLYMIEGFNTAGNASDPFVARHGAPSEHTTILFQNGPIKEHGVNGISGEALLVVVIDRLRCFQAGPYSSADNQEALDHCEGALEALQRRTKERLARGVEGTSIR